MLTEFQLAKKSDLNLKVENFINFDSTQITWDRENKADVEKAKTYEFDKNGIRISLYRPFFKQNMYFNRKLNNCIYQQYKHYPINSLNNISICTTGEGNLGFSVLIANLLPDLCFTKTGNGGSQCFPLHYYEENTSTQTAMFDGSSKQDYIKREGVSDFILERAQQQYGKSVTKEDIFYYVYGFLHSPEYRETFANDLKKMLPRLPLVEAVKDFWAFSKAGRQLADLHLNYESVPAYKGVIVLFNPLDIKDTLSQTRKKEIEYLNYRVQKMRFPKKDQKDSIIYNSQITIENIPARAYEYVVNGKSAIEWIMERYQVTTHKESGIVNDPNDWATEVGNPRYILDLLLSIINVSVQTVDIVNSLPKVKFGETRATEQ